MSFSDRNIDMDIFAHEKTNRFISTYFSDYDFSRRVWITLFLTNLPQFFPERQNIFDLNEK